MKASIILSLGAAAAVSAWNETMTTSTVYATSVYTVTSCAPTVTNCPVGHVTTEVVVDYTTVCPVAAGETTPPPYPTTVPAGPSTSTLYSTEVITISKCPETVTDCPYTTAPVTSTTIYTYPVGPTGYPSAPVPSVPVPASSPAGPVSSPPSSPATSPAPILSTITISTCIPTEITSVITVTPTSTPIYVPTGGPSAVIPKPPSNTTIPFSGAASQKAGGLLMAVGIVAALL